MSEKLQEITLRDYFAAQAISGCCAMSELPEALNIRAIVAYRIADEMLKERGLTDDERLL